jgi:hypothetical protein
MNNTGQCGERNEGNGETNVRGRESIINMKADEQMPIMNINNERGGGWHGVIGGMQEERLT